VAAMFEVGACCAVSRRSVADWFCCRDRGEEEESGVEGLRRELKSTADEERCIQARTEVSLECDSASLIVGDLESAGAGGRCESKKGWRWTTEVGSGVADLD